MYASPSTGIAGWAYLVIGGIVVLIAGGTWLVRNVLVRPIRAIVRRIRK